MRHWLQRIRGAIGIGVTWAVGWAPIGAIVGWITGLALGFPLAAIATNYGMMFGVVGFVGGTIFSSVVRIAEGRRSFEQLSMRRFVAWGAVGGLVLGGLSVALGLLGAGANVLGAVIAGLTTLLGTGSAAGTLALARASEGPHELEAGGAPRVRGVTSPTR